MACGEQQFGSLSRPCLRKKDDTFVVSSEHIQGKDDLINRKHLERSSGKGVPDDDIKRSTQAIRKATLRGKGGRETPHSEGTGTKTKIDTIPLPGNSCRSSLYRGPATIGAAADVRVQNRDNITRNDDVEQSRKDLIVRSHPRGREERGLRQNKSGVSQVANARVQGRSDIAEGFGRHPEDSILCASPHIYEIMGCDHTNKDSQEEKLGSKNAEKARDLEKQVNPYDEWVGTVEDNGYLREYGPELTGGKVSVDHSSFTTIVSIHGGRKATKKYKSVALLDSGSPSSFVTQTVIDEMSQRGAGSADMITSGKPRRWGGFTDSTEQLQTNSSACLNIISCPLPPKPAGFGE